MNDKKIFEKIANLNKVELKSETIELGVVDDLAKQTDSMRTLAKEIKTANANAEKLWKKWEELDAKAKEAEKSAQATGAGIEKKASSVDKKVAQAEKLWDKLQKAADALGVDPRAVKGYKEWDKAWDEMNIAQRDAKEYI